MKLKDRSRNRLALLKSREFYEWDIVTLIDWSRDPDSEVRSWATGALAARNDDSENIRSALLSRVNDIDFDTKSEAMVGLARRRDMRVLPYVRQALADERVGELFIEAAGYLADADLIAPLENLRSWWDLDEELLREALARCAAQKLPRTRKWEYVTRDNGRAR